VPHLCEVYPGIGLTTEEKALKNLSQSSRRMPVGKEYTEQSILVNERKRGIDCVGGLQRFWPIRAVERRSRDRCCIKPVGILTICRPENGSTSLQTLMPSGLVQGLCHCLCSRALIGPDPCSLSV